MLAAIVGLSYLFVFSFLSGGVQVFSLPGVEVAEPRVIVVFYESQSYSGPGLQIFWNSSMASFRLLVILLGAAISSLIYLNVYFLLKLWRLGQLKACLVRGTGTGLAVLLSSLASATYLCCGWAPTVLLLGVSLASSLGLAPALASAALLTLNAAILHKRLNTHVSKNTA